MLNVLVIVAFWVTVLLVAFCASRVFAAKPGTGYGASGLLVVTLMSLMPLALAVIAPTLPAESPTGSFDVVLGAGWPVLRQYVTSSPITVVVAVAATASWVYALSLALIASSRR